MNIEKYIGEKKQKGQWKYVLLIVVLAVLYTQGFSYVNWNWTTTGWIKNIITLALFCFFFLYGIHNKTGNFKVPIMLLILLPYLSMYNTNALYGQGYRDSFMALLGNYIWVLYFVFHKYKVKESTILRAFLIISLIIVAIQVLQQFTYPNALFGIKNPDADDFNPLQDLAEERNGLWRFRIGSNAYFTCVILFAALIWARNKVNTRLLILIGLMFVSVYLTLTRQVIGACLLASFSSLFLGKKSKGMGRALIIALVLGALLYSYSDVLFGQLAEQTKEDTSSDYIRILSAQYFWSESTSSPLLFLFGHGAPGKTGSYGLFLQNLLKYSGFGYSDVGFIGETYIFGAIYVVVCYWFLWKMFFTYKKVIPTYIRMFVIYAVVMSIMIFPMEGTITYLVWAMLAYICDLHINQAKALKRNVGQQQ